MVTKKDLIIAVLATFCLTATLFMIIPTRSQEYDPWLDTNDDGIIDIEEIYKAALAYGTMGDPTKNVNVTNWPVASGVTVWWGVWTPLNSSVTSQAYEANGFGHLHVLVQAWPLTGGRQVTFQILGRFPGTAADGDVVAYSTTLSESYPYRAITIPVPSEKFSFRIETDSIGGCYRYVSFYLTWA